MNKYDAYWAEQQKKAEAKKEQARIKKEEEKKAMMKDVKLEGEHELTGKTKAGKEVKFEKCWGVSKQSRWAGTLSVKQDGEWVTVFTKGYESKALQWMAKN
jgi:hypothetical protein